MTKTLDLPVGQIRPDTHAGPADGATTPARASVQSQPNDGSPVQGTNVPVGQHRPDTHDAAADGAPTPARANGRAHPILCPPVQGTSSDQPPAIVTSEPRCASPVADPMLALLADIVDDLERTRIANENRLRQLTRTETDSDGIERGFGLTLDHPQVAAIDTIVQGITALEHQAVLALGRSMRAHPLGAWVKRTQGVGEKQGARLIAAIGDPYWNTLHNRPRTVSELWAYCGYHVLRTGQSAPDTQTNLVGVAAARAKGQRANWSATAKMRAFLIAESCCKQTARGDRAAAPYRLVYDQGRAKYADSVHLVDCRRCGPRGKPALIGSPLSDGHKHARALRLVAKEVLKDLWIESKRLHEESA